MQLPLNYNKLSSIERRIVREEYITRQKGKCLYCSNYLALKPPADVLAKEIDRKLFPELFFSWPIHLHHSHTTGMTIGAVHALCNAVLWQYEGQ